MRPGSSRRSLRSKRKLLVGTGKQWASASVSPEFPASESVPRGGHNADLTYKQRYLVDEHTIIVNRSSLCCLCGVKWVLW